MYLESLVLTINLSRSDVCPLCLSGIVMISSDGVPASKHHPVFLWCTQPHPSLLQFLSTSGKIIQNNKCAANKDWSECSILPFLFLVYISNVYEYSQSAYILIIISWKAIDKAKLFHYMFVLNVLDWWSFKNGVINERWDDSNVSVWNCICR